MNFKFTEYTSIVYIFKNICMRSTHADQLSVSENEFAALNECLILSVFYIFKCINKEAIKAF